MTAPVVDRSQLGLLASWPAVIVDFAIPASTAGSLTINKVQARQVMYRTSRQQMIGLLAVTDPETNYSYVVRYGQTFYLRYESDILGSAVGAGGFAWIKSHFKMPPPQNGLARAVERFAAEVDDNALVQMETRL
jgi:hypothetical protein